MKNTLEMTFIFKLSQSGERIIKDSSLYSAQSILGRTRADGDLVESITLMVYSLVGPCGTDYNCVTCSANLRELQDLMKKSYKEALQDLQGNYLKDESSCGDMEACIATSGDWFEWVIDEHKIEL